MRDFTNTHRNPTHAFIPIRMPAHPPTVTQIKELDGEFSKLPPGLATPPRRLRSEMERASSGGATGGAPADEDTAEGRSNFVWIECLCLFLVNLLVVGITKTGRRKQGFCMITYI